MFDILDAEKKRITSFLVKGMSKKEYEVEARLFPSISDQYEYISSSIFFDIIKRLQFSIENGGLGLRNETSTQLHTTSEKNKNIRETIVGIDAIKTYLLYNDIQKTQKSFPDKVYRIEKKREDYLNLSNYPIRVCISKETEMDNKKFALLDDSSFSKDFRFQNRTSFFTDDNLFRIDMTAVKYGKGNTLASSNTIKNTPCYEIEVEYIGENTDIDVFTPFIQYISQLMCFYYKTPYLLPVSIKKKITYTYKSFIQTKKNTKNTKNHFTHYDFITAKPVTLHIENINKKAGTINILQNYGVTVKADGVNMLLYILPKGTIDKKYGNMFLIDSNGTIQSMNIYMEEWDNSLLEGEYIEHKNMFCVYDILYAKNLDIRNKPFESFSKTTSRLSYIKEFIDDVSTKEFTISIYEKPYLFGNQQEIFEKSKMLWDKRNLLPYHVDGLIFIPAVDPYPTRPGSWKHLFKWKPPSLNSIDFLVEFGKNENNQYILLPYTDESGVVKQYTYITIYTTSSNDSYNKRTGKVSNKTIKKIFKKIEVPVNDNEDIFTNDPLSKKVEKIEDNTIVEFSYKEGERFPWVPIRNRPEKTERYKKHNDYFGNYEKVAENIWKSITQPITEEMITSGIIPIIQKKSVPLQTSLQTSVSDNTTYTTSQNTKKNRLGYQNFHTAYVKKTLLQKVQLDPEDSERGKGHILDFGSCRGGDINRWKEIGFTKMVGVDLDPLCVQEAGKRAKNIDPSIVFLCGDLSKPIFPNQDSACETEEKKDNIDWKEKMKTTLVEKYQFDIVSSQFVIHYFFKDELSLRTYLQNVSDNLRIGGKFVCSTFDGMKIYDSLKRKKMIEGKQNKETIWKITKMYDRRKFMNGKPNWSMTIDVFVKSIGLSHKEYLVSYTYLEKIALEYGLELEETIPFSDLWDKVVQEKNINTRLLDDIEGMSKDEKTFSFFSSGLIFKKTKHPTDAVYKKMLKLQKKANK